MLTPKLTELKESPKSLIDWMRASQAHEEVFNNNNERSLISVTLTNTYSSIKTLEELITILLENDFSCKSDGYFKIRIERHYLSKNIDDIYERYEEAELTNEFRVKIIISEQETYAVLVRVFSKTFTLSYTPQNFWDRFIEYTRSILGEFVSFCRKLFGVTNHAPDTSPTQVPGILNSYNRAMSLMPMLELNTEKAKQQLARTPYAGDGKIFRGVIFSSPKEERSCLDQEDTFSASVSFS